MSSLQQNTESSSGVSSNRECEQNRSGQVVLENPILESTQELCAIRKSILTASFNEIKEFPHFLGEFNGSMDDCIEHCISVVHYYYAKTEIVENEEKYCCDIYITDFGSPSVHSSAAFEASGQFRDWVRTNNIREHFYTNTDGLARFQLPNGRCAGKCPDALLAVRPRAGQTVRYLGTIL